MVDAKPLKKGGWKAVAMVAGASLIGSVAFNSRGVFASKKQRPPLSAENGLPFYLPHLPVSQCGTARAGSLRRRFRRASIASCGREFFLFARR